MTIVRPILVAALVAGACQPWYRDPERRAQRAHDDALTERDLAAASADRARGDHARAAERLRALVERCPEAGAPIWIQLGDAETSAGRTIEGRAYVRWRLDHVAEGDDAVALRTFLIGSFVAEGRIEPALDLVRPPTLDAALRFDALAGPLRALDRAAAQASSDPDAALADLGAWLDAYGEPDHPILVGARAAILAAAWRAADGGAGSTAVARLRRLAPLARDELRRGHAAAALALYARAAELLPAAEFEPYRAEMERAAGSSDPSVLDPDAYALARDGDAMLRDGKLGAAIARYRKAVASAPWWRAARQNLEALLAVNRAGSRE